MKVKAAVTYTLELDERELMSLRNMLELTKIEHLSKQDKELRSLLLDLTHIPA